VLVEVMELEHIQQQDVHQQDLVVQVEEVVVGIPLDVQVLEQEEQGIRLQQIHLKEMLDSQ
jgi:hypothetical protein